MELTQRASASVFDQVVELTQQVKALLHQVSGQSEKVDDVVLDPSGKPDRDGHLPDLPDASIIRQTIRSLQLRARFFPKELFADPAWNMLLDLAAAHREGKQISVTSLCIASGVPGSTALRWINVMEADGLIRRSDDRNDRRRAFLSLTDDAIEAMACYFSELR